MEREPSSYDCYKADTNYVANWLAQTAKQCGFTFPVINKQSRGNAKRSILPARQFSILAAKIAIHKPAILVPGSLRSALRNAVAARQQSYDRHVVQSTTQQDLHSDEQHLYFINVLKDTLSSIQALWQVATKRQESLTGASSFTKHSPLQTRTILVKYTIPSVEDESEGEATQEDPTTNPESRTEPTPSVETSELQQNPNPETLFEAEAVDDVVETWLAVQCLINEVDELRTCIFQTWSRYAASEVDLITAAVTVNTAISIVQKLESNFKRDFPKAEMEAYFTIWLEHQVVACGIKPIEEQSPVEISNAEFASLADKILFVPKDTFMQLTGAPEGQLPAIEPDLQQIPPSRDWSNKSNQEKYEDDTILMRQMIGPVYILAISHPTGLGAEDGLVQAIHEFRKHKNKGPSLWVCFAAQSYLEAHHALGEQIERPLLELRRLALAIRATAVEALKYHLDTKFSKKPLAREYRIYHYLIYCIDKYIIEDSCLAWCKEALVDATTHSAPYEVFRNHPSLCGITAFRITESAYGLGLDEGVRTFSVVNGAHLFNAITHEGICDQPWPALQTFMSFCPDKELYNGIRPQNKNEYQLRIMQAMGWDPANAAADRKVSAYRWKKDKKVTPDIPLLTMLIESYYGELSEFQQSTPLEKLEFFLNKRHADDTTEPRNVTHLSAPELLRMLTREMEREIPLLKLDLFALHRDAWSCLRRIEAVLHKPLASLRGPDFSGDNKALLPMIALFIFDICLGSSSRIASAASARLPSFLHDKILSIVGGTVEQFLKGLSMTKSHHPLAGRYDDPSVGHPRITLEDIPELKKMSKKLKEEKSRRDAEEMSLTRLSIEDKAMR